LAAISASGTPARVVGGGGPYAALTYQDVAQDMVDYLAWAQVEYPVPNITKEGGWDYSPVNNGVGGSSWKGDQSQSGYVVLGLAEAEVFGCTVRGWVKTELNWWIDYVQDDVTGDTRDGGSWYSYPGDPIGVNILKTGNLIFQMAFVGDTPATPRVQDAVDYLERHWADASGANSPPGWDGNPAQYQAMFCAMKGLEYMGIDTFGAGPIDWFEDFSDAIVAQQTASGAWTSSSGRGNDDIITAWALLTLERVAPPPVIRIEVDKHYSYTNVCFERDNDRDGAFNEDPVDWELVDLDGDGIPETRIPIDNDGDGLFNEDDVDCPDGSYLGDQLPQDAQDFYVLEAVVHPKNNKVSSYNPGQYYAVSTVNVLSDVDMLTIEEDWGDCGIGDLNPKKGGGKVVIVMLGDDGTAYQILDAKDEAVTVDEDNGMAWVELEDVPAGTTILMYVKFKPAVKEWAGPLRCVNTNSAWVGSIDDRPAEPVESSALLMLIAKE
jgi:hypothetical protein